MVFRLALKDGRAKFQFAVLQRNLDVGVRCHAERCAIANALEDSNFIMIGVSTTFMIFEDKEYEYRIRNPLKLQEWIIRYDKGQVDKPVKFMLTGKATKK